MDDRDERKATLIERGLAEAREAGYTDRLTACYLVGRLTVIEAGRQVEIDALKAEIAKLKAEKAGIREKHIERVSELHRLIGKAQREGRENLAKLHRQTLLREEAQAEIDRPAELAPIELKGAHNVD